MSIVDVDPYLALQWDRWLKRRSSSARDHLIVSYAPLVKFIAGRVGAGLPSSVDPGDLVSSGVIGLIDAIERFDPQRGFKFETFATPAHPRRDLRRPPRARLGPPLVRSGPGRSSGGSPTSRPATGGRRATTSWPPTCRSPGPSCTSGCRPSPRPPSDRWSGRSTSAPSPRAQRRGPDRPLGRDRGPRGPRGDAARRSTSSPTARSWCSRCTTTRASRWPRSAGFSASARAGCRRSTPSRCSTWGPHGRRRRRLNPGRLAGRRPPQTMSTPGWRPRARHPAHPAVIALLAPPPAPVVPAPAGRGAVVDPYCNPPCVWCSGNRGLTYAPARYVRCGQRRPARSRSAASSPGPATSSSTTPTVCGRPTAGWR